MLAIVALVGGMIWGAVWLYHVMGIVGAILVAVWARGLLRDTGKVLLDAEMDAPVVEKIREVIASQTQPVEIWDLHVWRVGREKYACVVALVSDTEAGPEHYRQALGIHEELVHITVEVNKHPI